MDATAVVVASITSVPLCVAAMASVVAARRSGQARDASTNAVTESAAAKRSSKAAEVASNAAAQTTQTTDRDLTALFAMLSRHIADNTRHLERRAEGR